MTREQFHKKIEELSLAKDKSNAEHPYRQTAIAIIEQIIEPRYARERGINGEAYYKLEDEIVSLLDSYLK